MVGREEVRQAVLTLLRSGTRLVTLLGPGGVGKTRLALAVLADLQDDYPAGVRWIDLSALRNSALVLPAIGRALGLREDAQGFEPEQLAAHLAGQRTVLALDNLEQVADAAVDIAGLLELAPTVTVLVTSRVPLRVRGEVPVEVAPLQLPEPVASVASVAAVGLDVESLARVPAVDLFLQRARAARPGFVLDATSAHAVARIVARLDGLPLALELAAARLVTMSPVELLEVLSTRLPILVDGPRDLPTRHRTLTSTISWSYDLLTPAQQQVFAELAVFSGGCTVAAAVAVCRPDPSGTAVAASISALAEHSLIGLQSGATGELRVQLLETVQEYAAERLAASGVEAQVRRRHAEYFLDRARETDAGLHGPAQVKLLSQLEAELDNLRAALAWSSQPASAILGLQLVCALVGFWRRRGYLEEGRSWLVRGLTAARQQGVPPEARMAEAAALMGFGLLAGHQGDRVESRTRLTEAVELWRALPAGEDQRRGLATALGELGRMGRDQATTPDWAEELFTESLTLSLEVGDDVAAARAYAYQARFVYAERGDFAAARAVQEKSLRLASRAGDVSGTAQALLNLGELARAEGQYETADQLYEESLELFLELDEPLFVAACQHNLGYSALHRNDIGGAAARFAESQATHRRVGNRRGIAECLVGLGVVAVASGDLVQGTELLSTGYALLRLMRASLDHTDRQEYENALERARSQLPETSWSEAVRRGEIRAMRGEPPVTAVSHDSQVRVSSLAHRWGGP
jgi:predicted ATPase